MSHLLGNHTGICTVGISRLKVLSVMVQEIAEGKPAQNGRSGEAKRKASNGELANGQGKQARLRDSKISTDAGLPSRREYIDKTMEAEWSD